MLPDAYEEAKREASLEALHRYIRSDTVIGIGSGSTIRYVIEELGKKLATGDLVNIHGIPTSAGSEELMRKCGISTRCFNSLDCPLDLAIDGADSVSSDFCAIKGRGGALLREKLVALRAKKFVVVCDASKWPFEKFLSHDIPVEIITFGHTHTMARIGQVLHECAADSLECTPSPNDYKIGDINGKSEKSELILLTLRAEKTSPGPFITQNGNYIVDVTINRSLNRNLLKKIARSLKSICGVVEHGIFETIPADIVVADGKGKPTVFSSHTSNSNGA